MKKHFIFCLCIFLTCMLCSAILLAANGTALQPADASAFSKEESSYPFILYPDAEKADMTAILEAALSQHGTVWLAPGSYLIQNLNMPADTSITGCGKASKLVVSSPEANGVVMAPGCSVENVEIMGPSTTRPDENAASGILIASDGKTAMKNPKITNCIIHGFGNGIYMYQTGYSAANGTSILNCEIYQCHTGIHCGVWTEYNRITNVICSDCTNGALNNGGNNVFVNCTFASNTTAVQMMVKDAKVYSNNGHGSFIGCSFNHNDGNNGYAIIMDGIRHGFVFSGCQFWYGKVLIDHSKGILFDSCEFGGGDSLLLQSNPSNGLVHFSDCLFSYLPKISGEITMTDCYTFAGQRVTAK